MSEKGPNTIPISDEEVHVREVLPGDDTLGICNAGRVAQAQNDFGELADQFDKLEVYFRDIGKDPSITGVDPNEVANAIGRVLDRVLERDASQETEQQS